MTTQALRPGLLGLSLTARSLRPVGEVLGFGAAFLFLSLLCAAPVAWAIYHGEQQTGVTIIHMSVHLDAGAMLAREVLDILPDETAGEL